MSWARYDDALPYNRKVAWLRAHGEAGVAALGLHLLANTWARHEGMLGFIPDYVPEQLVGKPHAKLARLLTEIEMFTVTEGGWMINDYEEYGDRDDGTPVDEKKARLSKVRAEAGRKGGHKKAANAQQRGSKPSSKPPPLVEANPKQSSTPVPDPDPVGSSARGERPETLRSVPASSPPEDEERCSRHPNGNPTDEACNGCKRVKERRDRREAKAAEKRQREDEDRARNCPTCEGTHFVLDAKKLPTGRRCDHRRAS